MKNATQGMKRILSFIMAFAMVLTLLPGAVFAAEQTMTIYFENNWDWPDAKIHWWGSSTGTNPAWPGTQLTEVVDTTAAGYDRYKIEVPTDITGMLFHGTGGYGTDQSTDITSGWYDGICYYMTYDSATNTKPAASYKYAPVTALKSPSGSTNKVYFDNTAKGWDTVYVYYWDNTKTYDLTCTWPGKVMTSEGDNLYSYDVPVEATHLIFNNNSAQKADLENPNDGTSVYDGSSWSEYTAGGEDTTVTYYAVGNVELFGATTEVDPEKPLVLNADGKYEVTYENVSVGTHYFYITDSENEIKYNGENVEFTLDAVSNVTIIFDAEAESATYEVVVVDTTDPSTPTEGEEESDTITVYFRNDWLWTDVCCYAFDSAESYIGTAWPGAAMTLCDNDGTYDIYKAEIPANVAGIVFNGTKDDGSGATDQTPDITTGIEDGAAWYIHYDGGNKASKFEYTPAGGGEGGETTDPSTPTEATYIVAGTAALCGTEWDVANTSNKMTLGADGLYTITYESVAPGTHSFKVTDGTWDSSWGGSGADGNYEITLEAVSDVTITFNASTEEITVVSEETGEVIETVEYKATFHFANTVSWSTVNLYAWLTGGTTINGGWPGTAVTMGSDGYYSATLTYEAAANEGLNFIFNNGTAQTIDLALSADAFTESEGVYTAEKWVVLTTQTDGKYNAAIVDNADAIVTSPVVSGSSVTFNYGDNDATSVAVAGSFNGWEPADMTKGEDGVWTLTVNDLAAGDYQYKFVVDGNWILDPMNSNVVTEADGNQNSAFYILSGADKEDDNKVTINVHYTRTGGDYDGWNLWVWGSALDGHQVDFESTDENGAKVATIVLEDARAHTNISFKERLSVEGNEWKDQGSSDRTIDLSTVVSGTIDYYLPAGTCVFGDDVIRKNKVTSVDLNYDTGAVTFTTAAAVEDPETEITLVKAVGETEEEIEIKVSGVDRICTISLTGENAAWDLTTLYQYKIKYQGFTYDIAIDAVYASDKFAEEYTYTGTDLGATYSSASTTFKVWAPTAEAVSVNLYADGTVPGEGESSDLSSSAAMTKGEKGVWYATVSGDLNGTYYTYAVTVDGETVEAVDPYARTAGVNGNRGMVIDLDSTDPADWASDTNPNKITSYTDAVIYELHVRDFSNHESSGMTNKGKYLAFTEEGTTTPGGTATGIDYLDELGVTHVHLLPVYDYGSVDETTCENFNWGYDPVNYNVPEGSYSTKPYDGANRVSEFKQMVKSLHDHDISVIMDVVYNHVYNADKFCFNNIVPGYFSRVDSNRSGCGNDTASEREMVRKYIVESVMYWHEEYHIDGFRFDLVGLLDVETINQIVEEVHACCPDVIFYGEGWDMDGTNKEPGTEMAKQGNASKTSGFAYFSDSIRNGIGGSNGTSKGFASGAGNGADMVTEWLGNPWWINNPQQVIQYASCHDNYTLIDKIVLSTDRSKLDDTVIKMNNLAAAFYMTAQGVPFIHAGEEFLREKLEEDGTTRCENSYNASDYVNNIIWSNLDNDTYAANSEYYKGLIEFRKAHPALRYSTATEVQENIQTVTASANLIAMQVDGYGAGDDDIYVIFNAASSAQTVTLPEGTWTININGTDAGTTSLGTAAGSVNVDGISAMVLTKEDEGKDEAAPVGPSEAKTLYFSNNMHWDAVYAYAWDSNGNVVTGESWPGVAMTYVETNDYKEDIYSVALPASDVGIAGVVFHNNSGVQTVDIKPGAHNTGYYCDGTAVNADGEWEVGTYTYQGALGTAEEYFLIGYINGADYTGAGYKFDKNGTVTTTFTADSYVYVVNGDNSEVYMTDGYLGAVSPAVLKDTSKHTLTGKQWDKLLISGGDEVVITMVKNDDNTITLSYETTAVAYEDKSGVQDGVTLHCWNWSFDNITANMAKIAEQGYTAIQTSPIQAMKEATSSSAVGSHWWVYYQPVDFVITTDSGNALGTKTDFAKMCAEADKYGIKVIVDVVANHLGNKTGNDLADAIPDYLRKAEYWHDITKNIDSWTDRENMTQRCLNGLPDLNTANKDIQNYVLTFLKECVDAGADGFRFDMAKSIETPKDDASFASDFWPTVVNGIQEYAGGDLYIYGEVLDDAAIAISAYTQYMSVTDNGWGNHMRTLVNGGTAGLVQGFYKSADPSNLVIWAESHDTYATDDESQSSAGVSEANINKTWALVAARADAMGLYLARPAELTQLLGVASATGWDNPEVAAVNKFHNAFNGQSETIGNSGNISYVVRGTTGVVLVNVSGTTAEVSSLNVGMEDGTYADQISGTTFTVADGKITGTIGETGIAVVYGEPKSSSVAMIGDAEYETLNDAIEAAAEGDEIDLTADVEVETLALTTGNTLDLNGRTLTVGNAMIFEGNHIIDTAGTGLLKVQKDRLMIDSDNNKVLPIWDDENQGYVFTVCSKLNEKIGDFTNGKTYIFLPVLDAADYELIAAGAETSDVELKVEVTWNKRGDGMPASVTFKYTDELMQRFYAGYDAETGRFGNAFLLTLTGTDSVDNLAFRVLFESGTGVMYYCDVE